MESNPTFTTTYRSEHSTVYSVENIQKGKKHLLYMRLRYSKVNNNNGFINHALRIAGYLCQCFAAQNFHKIHSIHMSLLNDMKMSLGSHKTDGNTENKKLKGS